MRFIMKHMSKKTLSVILSVMIILSTVAVAFSVIADPVSDPFVVTLGRPAIPMQVGKTIDLNTISVQFSESETVTGDQIAWSTEEANLLLDTTTGYLSTFAVGTYQLKATKVGTTQSKTVYVVVNLDGAATYTIYDHTFTADEINADANNFEDNSEWTLVPYSTIANGQFKFTNEGLTAGNNHVNFVLKPTSESAKTISAFRDLAVNAEIAFSTWFSATGADFVLGARAQFTNNTPAYSAATYVGGGYRVALTPQVSAAGNKDYGRIYVSGKSSKVEFEEAYNSYNDYRSYTVKAIGNTVELYREETKANLPMTDDQKTAIENTQGGTLFITSANTVRAIIKSINVTIEFSAEELAKIAYIDYYFTVPQNKPAIPVELNTKVSLDNIAIEFADGSFMLGSDVVWENNNGAIDYDEAENAFSIYAEGMFTVKAKKNASDEGTEIYLITPDEKGLYTIYEHTFSADDMAPATTHDGKLVSYEPNSNYWWGTWMAQYSTASKNVANPNGDWEFRNENSAPHFGKEQAMFEKRAEVNPDYPPRQASFNDCYYWPIGVSEVVSADDITANSNWTFTANKGLHIATNQPGWIYLKPDSKAGKIIGRFSDYTIDYTYVTNLTNASYTIPVLGRFSANTADYVTDKAVFTLVDETYLGAYIPHGKSTYTGVSTAFSGDKSRKDTTTQYTIDGGEYNAKIKLSGNNVTVSMKKSTDTEYTLIGTTPSDVDTSTLTGTIAIRNLNETRQYNKAISVSLDYSAEELAKLQVTDADALYNLTQDFPAVPMKQATMLDLSKVLVELPDGNFIKGDMLDWSCDFIGAEFFIDNATKMVYAYGEGRYDATVTKGGESVMEAHFVVADDNGNYKIFDHTFTEADLTALGGTGKSDMWIATTNNALTPLKDYAKNSGSGNATFEEGKGISIYANANSLLILNPEHKDAQVISKFKNQTIDFTSSLRTANNAGTAWTLAGYVGAVGRIDFGAGGTFEMRNGNYYTTDNPELDHHILGAFYPTTNQQVYIDTTEGFTQNSTLRISYYVRTKNDCPTFNQTYVNDSSVTRNYRVELNETDITLSVAPDGTASYTKLYSSDEDTALEDRKKAMLPTANRMGGTIALYTNGGSRGYFSKVSVSINFNSLPELVSLGECRDEESRLLYMQVGESLDLTKINFQSGDRYYNGSLLTFQNVPTGLTVVEGDSITPTAVGVYTLTAEVEGTSFDLTIAVSEAGGLFDNGNYTLGHTQGIINTYDVTDASQPYSQYLLIPSEIGGDYIYEIGAGFAGVNEANKEIIEIQIDKYIEKIGGGAFLGAEKLSKVKIPNTVTEIGSSAFAGATALKDLFLPGSVEVIGEKAFDGDTDLRVVIANKNAVIGDGAFVQGATIVGFAGSTAEAYATANGITFVELAGDEITVAEDSYNDWIKFKADRLTTVDTDVEWIIHKQNDYGKITYQINGFKPGNRAAGKYIIPATVEYEGETVNISTVRANAFDSLADSRAIYTLEFEDGVNSTGFYAFRNCYNIQSIKFNENFSSIGWFSFSGCSSLVSVDLPASVGTVGPRAFENCTNLETFNIPVENSILAAFGAHTVRLTESPEGVFNGTKVTVIKLPVTVNRITTSSFADSKCKVRELWVYNKDLQFIDSFPNDNKEGYVLPAGTVIYGVKGSTAEEYATKWGHEFHEIPDFYVEQDGVLDSTGRFAATQLDDGSYGVGRFVGVGGKVIMPSAINVGELKNAPITVIPSSAFQFEGVPANGINRIIQLEISEGYVTIEDEAFRGAEYLKSVKLPNTLRTIGKMAFATSGLTGTVEIPKSVTEIGQGAFRGIAGLTDVYIYNENANIGAAAFDAGVTIHGVKNSPVHDYALENKLKFVEIESNKATTSDFSDNGNYTFTVDENGVITGYARKDDSKPYSLKVAIPATVNGVKVTGVGEGVFEDGAEKSSVYAITIAEGVTDIANNAFNGLSNLSYIDFPESLKTIGDSAFIGTALTGDIVLHDALESIGKDAFKGCFDIDSITVESKTVVLKANCLPRGSQKTVLKGYTGSTTEEFAKSFNVKFEYLDGGPEEPVDPGEDPGEEPNEDPQDPDYSGDPITPPGDTSNGNENNIYKVIRQSDLTMVIIIAVSLLLLVVLLAMAVVVVVVIKSKRDSIY